MPDTYWTNAEGEYLIDENGDYYFHDSCCCEEECPGDDDCVCCCCNIDSIDFTIAGVVDADCDECASTINGTTNSPGGPAGCQGVNHGTVMCVDTDFEAAWDITYTLRCPADTLVLTVTLTTFKGDTITWSKEVSAFTSPGQCGGVLDGSIPNQSDSGAPWSNCDPSGATLSVVVHFADPCVPI